MFKKINRLKKLSLSLIMLTVLWHGSAEHILKIKYDKVAVMIKNADDKLAK